MKKLVLLVGENRLLVDAVRETVVPLEMEVLTVADRARADEHLQGETTALVLLPLRGEEPGGLELIDRCRCSHPPIPVIALAAGVSPQAVVRAFRRGVCDVLLEPFTMEEVSDLCRRVLVHYGHGSDAAFTRRAVAAPESPSALVGESEGMREVRRLIRDVASARCNVLVTGESGTGKELVAREIHSASASSAGPFVAVNCAALPPTLLESELFGHVRGSFTGAHQDRAGYFEVANGGTLFLDEVGDMPLPLQPKLLRAIQEREIHRVGATRPTPIDVRLVTATNRDLRQECVERRFREDLFFRICVIEIRTPPLRRRKEDLPLLLDHLMRRISRDMGKPCRGLADGVLHGLVGHSWPGNVRELENVIERALTVGKGEHLRLEDFPAEVCGSASAVEKPSDIREASRRFERDHIRTVLWETRGNREEAARRLGVNPSTLYRKLLELGIGSETKSYRRGTSEMMPAMGS